jgi:hypothetical protein
MVLSSPLKKCFVAESGQDPLEGRIDLFNGLLGSYCTMLVDLQQAASTLAPRMFADVPN